MSPDERQARTEEAVDRLLLALTRAEIALERLHLRRLARGRHPSARPTQEPPCV